MSHLYYTTIWKKYIDIINSIKMSTIYSAYQSAFILSQSRGASHQRGQTRRKVTTKFAWLFDNPPAQVQLCSQSPRYNEASSRVYYVKKQEKKQNRISERRKN